jgi:murein L,D-transpeptidase YcbB/YkuD
MALYWVWLTLGIGVVWAQPDPIEERIQTRIDHLRQIGTLTIGNARIASTRVLADFYERRQFKPAWTDATATDDLFRAIRDSEQDGLDPADYHLAELDRLHAAMQAEATLPSQSSADVDLLQTDALIRLGYHLLVGKVDPERLDSNWNLSYEIHDLDPVVVLQTMIDSGNLYQAIDSLKPQHRFYTLTTTWKLRSSVFSSVTAWRKTACGRGKHGPWWARTSIKPQSLNP